MSDRALWAISPSFPCLQFKNILMTNLELYFSSIKFTLPYNYLFMSISLFYKFFQGCRPNHLSLYNQHLAPSLINAVHPWPFRGLAFSLPFAPLKEPHNQLYLVPHDSSPYHIVHHVFITCTYFICIYIYRYTCTHIYTLIQTHVKISKNKDFVRHEPLAHHL